MMSNAVGLQRMSCQLPSASRIRLLATATMLCAASFAMTLHAAEPKSLTWSFAKGDRLQGQTTKDLTIVFNVGHNKKKQAARYTFDTSWNIVQAEQGQFEAHIQIDRVRFRLNRPDVAAAESYDSRDGARDPGIATVLSNIVGTKFRLRFRNDGRKVECKIDDGSAVGINQLRNTGTFERPLLPPALITMVESMIISLPEKPVSPKTSWETTRHMFLPDVSKPVDGKTKHTYSGQTDNGSQRIVSSTEFPTKLKAELTGTPGTIRGLRVSGITTLGGPSGAVSQSKVDTNYILVIDARDQAVKLETSIVLTHRLRHASQ